MPNVVGQILTASGLRCPPCPGLLGSSLWSLGEGVTKPRVPPRTRPVVGSWLGGFEGSGGAGRALIQDLPAVAGWWLSLTLCWVFLGK